jgi:dephospho-CoA kinase
MGKLIIGFVGDLASGKGTVCKYLKEKYGINAYRYSTMLRDILKRVYQPDSRNNMQLLSRILRENFGQDLMSRVIAEDAINDQERIVAVEGIRRPTDIIYLEKMPEFHLIYITAESKIRWDRLVKRKENPGDAEKTYEQFLADEQAEADRLIKELGGRAESVIINNGTFDELYAQVDRLISQHANKN